MAGSDFVGDAATDLIAARQVGCRAFLVLTGRGVQQLVPSFRAVGGQFTITRNLPGAVAHIFQLEAMPVAARRGGIVPSSVMAKSAWVRVAPEK